MGGTAKRVGMGVATGGLSEFARVGKGDAFGADLVKKGLGFGDKSPSKVPQMGQQSPLSMLQNSGGAPLLTSIALGVSHKDALASYFGIDPKNYDTWKASLSPSEQQSIGGLESTLGTISNNTELKTQAVNQLVNDFPNYMASAIPKYKGIADEATLGAAQKALDQTAAKYAAGGQLSSGATAAAMARTGADTAYQNLSYGTQLAGQDWTAKFNQANALQNFQQKMLGQGATQGFNAIQNALQQNQQAGLANQNMVLKQNETQQAQSGAMMGALGQLGGTALGGYFMGPMGAMAGSKMGGALADGNSGTMASPRLNLQPNYGMYPQGA